MEKQRLFRIMAKMDTKDLKKLAEPITKKYEVTLIKKPTKTLAMIKMREPVKRSLFYLGEVMVCEAITEVDGSRGIGVTMGDDYEKVLQMAILDSGFNHVLPEMEAIREELLRQEKKQIAREEQENALHLKTMVNFNTMAGEN